MLFFFAKVIKTTPLTNPVTIASDPWSFKDLKNYQAYYDHNHKVIPTLNNRLPEHRLWQLNQPGYLRSTPEKFLDTGVASLFSGDGR